MTQWNRVFLSLAACAAITGTFACVNIYSPIDKPSGDKQLLSAARAAFDRGDVAKAREFYGKVSGDESAASELVFLDLDSCGADIDAFATALSQASKTSNNPGVLITVMAEKMNAKVSTACFATLLQAFKNSRAIVDVNLRGFTSFLASVAIAGEVLGSNTNIAVDGQLDKLDFIGTPSTCNTFPGTCAGCPVVDGITQAATVTLTSASTIAANWGVLQGAITAANTALTELGISAGPSFSLISQLGTSGTAVSNSDPNYRCLLTSLGVGR